MAKDNEQELWTISELEETERLVNTLSSTLEVLIAGCGAGMCSDGHQSADVLELVYNYIRDIAAKLDGLGQCILRDRQKIAI